MKIIRAMVLYGCLIMSLFLLWQTILQSKCKKITKYDIGKFDTRFGIEREGFIDAITRSEEVWEKISGRELFSYSPGADFKINLIYSEEQSIIDKGQNLTQKLDSKGTGLESIQGQYDATLRQYQSSLNKYERAIFQYEKDVDYWNTKGGAPSSEYVKIQSKKKGLDNQASTLNELQSRVNILADQINIKVEDYNKDVNQYNELFSQERQFDAGNTNGSEINVYSYNTLGELHTLLVHEFGHVLGIDHLDDPQSVMHFMLNDQNNLGELSKQDIQALTEVCRI